MILAIVWSHVPRSSNWTGSFCRPTRRNCNRWAGCAGFCTGRRGSGSPRRQHSARSATPTSPRCTCGPRRAWGRVRRFGKGKTKEQMARAGGDGRVVLLGIAQERTRIGGRGRPRAKSMWRLRIWSGPGRWALSTTSISRCGPGLGRGVLEDHRLPPWPVYPAEWAQLGAAAMRTARHRLHLPGPRVRRLREPRLAAADLRPTRIQRGEKLLWRWHKRVRPLGFPLSFAPDRRWRHVLDN